MRHPVVDGLRGNDHRRHPGLFQQALGLIAGGTAIQEDQLQATLFGQNSGQPPSVGRYACPRWGLQQQFMAIGVAAEMEYGDAVSILGVAEHGQDLLQGGVGAHHHLADRFGVFQDVRQLPRLLGQLAQILDAVI